jgi:PAS domain S-box-containing protein
MRDRQHERNSVRSEKINLPTKSNRPRRKPNRVHTAADAFSACFEHANVGLSIADLEGRLLEVNAAFCSLTGYTESELLETFYAKRLIHSPDLKLEQEKMSALIAGEIPAFVIEERFVKRDRAIIWVQNNVSLVSDQAGRPEKIARLTQDITARKLAEASLREVEARNETARHAAERQYQEIFENAGEGIFRSTPEGYYLTANPALARMHGFDSPAELIRSRRDISREVYVQPTQRDEFKRLLEEQGEVRGFEHQTFRKDGSKIWISVNAHAVRDDTGRILYYEGTAQDITERKRAEQALRESEERYRELFENSKDAFYVHDMNGVYVSVNRAAEKLSGYRRHEIIGRHFSEFMPPESARQVQQQLEKKLELSGETTYEIEITTKKGKHIPVEVSSRLILEQGVPVGVQGCVRDISERRQAHEAARNYSRRLIEAQEAERRRISRELHDQVGQILTAVKMNLHALQQTCTRPQELSSIADNLKVIDEAVDQVRDLSVDLRPLLLDDFGLVVALRWYLERQTRNIGVPAKFVSGSLDEDDRFSSELETACFRIVQEGVTNIVRHARATRISVRLERVLSELILLISDDGAGFDARRVRSGTGGSVTLGLRGMEERAYAIGGTITIDSAPALGTEICARLPIRSEKRKESELTRAVQVAKA